MILSDCPSTKTSSMRLAKEITGTSVTPTARINGKAALSCPLPPSMIIRSGIGQSVSLP